MRPHLFVCFLVSLPALVLGGAGKASTKPPAPPGDPSWTLGLRVYRSLCSEPGSVNTLFSPLLLASALGALGEGSAGATASQLRALLDAPPAAEPPLELLPAALRSVEDANGTSFHLRASSALFSQQTPTPTLGQAFAKRSKDQFKLQHHAMGKGDAKAHLKQLHAWAKDRLGGLEVPPLEAGVQAKAGALIVANALRFQGLWEREFSVDSADRRTFLGRKYTKVMMMHRAGLYRHYEDMQNMVQVLEAKLCGGRASVVLLLPFHVEDLSRLDKLLTPERLSEWLEKSNVSSVAVSLPKANISSTLSLQRQLSALGLTDAWDPEMADFSGAAGDGSRGKLHLGGVLHWASLELSAAAGERSADPEEKEEHVEKPKLFYADHPFIILVRDNATGALLLLGALDLADGEPLHDEL